MPTSTFLFASSFGLKRPETLWKVFKRVSESRKVCAGNRLRILLSCQHRTILTDGERLLRGQSQEPRRISSRVEDWALIKEIISIPIRISELILTKDWRKSSFLNGSVYSTQHLSHPCRSSVRRADNFVHSSSKWEKLCWSYSWNDNKQALCTWIWFKWQDPEPWPWVWCHHKMRPEQPWGGHEFILHIGLVWIMWTGIDCIFKESSLQYF